VNRCLFMCGNGCASLCTALHHPAAILHLLTVRVWGSYPVACKTFRNVSGMFRRRHRLGTPCPLECSIHPMAVMTEGTARTVASTVAPGPCACSMALRLIHAPVFAGTEQGVGVRGAQLWRTQQPVHQPAGPPRKPGTSTALLAKADLRWVLLRGCW